MSDWSTGVDWSVVVVVACGALVATSPWWVARAGVRARLAGLTRGVRVASGAGAVGPVEIGVLLELLGAAVRAGTSVPRALEAVGQAIGGPDGAALHRAGAAVVLGAGWVEAWAGAPPRLAMVQSALGLAWEQGAAPGEALRAAGEQLRSDQQAAARQAAARLAVHLVLPLGVCFLPAFVLIGLLPVLLSLGGGVLGD
ncbi:type II secretion system F family protein [Oerskovia gallyi]|uniref:Type II secretion system F family protein n=1 Tax=Oerskovia gallyi TaxID=2762226 RepID=A0ABR8V6N8_9CELL|nr:type II secretion system F family protein [Oerskovia gallyi]MBD8000447.1 type II secretion system F family protein [Oerskovia gallyi]